MWENCHDYNPEVEATLGTKPQSMTSFMTIFKALLDYHARTRRYPICRHMGDEVEELLVSWDTTHGKRS
jgi:hypothetical protein